MSLSLKDISMSYKVNGNKNKVLENISLEIENGGILSIFGPNGCGKTTLLNIISGILNPDSGTIDHNQNKKKISYIFQNFNDTLFPWKTCFQNIAFPLEIFGDDKKTRDKKVHNIIKELGIDFQHKYTYQCSGGQKQLVCIARALVTEPELLIMDEPFANLDYSTRLFMENKLLEIWDDKKVSTIFVSHDADEAIYLADKVVLLKGKPSKVVDILNVDLTRPRTHSILGTIEFAKLKQKLLEVFV